MGEQAVAQMLRTFNHFDDDAAHKPLFLQNMNCSAFFEFGYFKLH